MFFLAYGVVCYLAFLGAFLYLMGFVEGMVVPKGINDGAVVETANAILVNLGLIALLGVQHSVMARPTFKNWWTRFVPRPIERSTFVLITSAIFALMFWQWRPLPDVVWSAAHPALHNGLLGLSFAGWGLVLYSSFLIDHFDLFGLRQVWFHARGRPYAHPPFAMPALYRLVRNPLMLGFLIAFWSAPVMTQGRLLFCAGMTIYILIGVAFEERNLAEILGDDYRRYRARTPMLLPWPRGGARSPSALNAEN